MDLSVIKLAELLPSESNWKKLV